MFSFVKVLADLHLTINLKAPPFGGLTQYRVKRLLAYYLTIIRVIAIKPYYDPALSEGTMYTTLDTLSSFIKVKFNLINDSTFFMLNPTLLLHSLYLLALYLFTQCLLLTI
jgi:hypothetical protein